MDVMADDNYDYDNSPEENDHERLRDLLEGED